MNCKIFNDFEKKVVNYFGSNHWCFIKHPNLNYECPYIFYKKNKNISKIEQVFNNDIHNYIENCKK